MDARCGLTLVENGSDSPEPKAPVRKHTLIREAYGRVLREVRRDQDRTVGEVAAGAGMSKQYLSEIERGKKEPSSEMLLAICGALGMPLEHLLFRAGRKIVALHSVSPDTGTSHISGPVLMAA